MAAGAPDRGGQGAGGECIELALTFADGVTATVNISNIRTDKVRRFTVGCRDGDLAFDDFAARKLNVTSRAMRPSPIAEAMKFGTEMPLTAAVRSFAEDIEARRRGGDRLRIGIDVVRVLSGCQAALEI